MVTVVVIEFSGMRCQPLRRALVYISDSEDENEN
ncbi:acetyltransferase [Vibrio cholerae]|uniref:Acetyltransferase n=1 Tax=Vibrio cholerae TaxID=666 RepID=A0A8B5ZJC0_VIBCL|nr:acetyltransferase [Vibrio cholerae]RBM56883.1 acetyltransferase [Vibrio paracholerae]MCD1189444.1 acetyltransferase [Vibrio cholerae]MEB5529347.1 acetyltransferase [Vibrio cholerae]TXY56224.1 acetyltransferase [Vibrio cholerae]